MDGWEASIWTEISSHVGKHNLRQRPKIAICKNPEPLVHPNRRQRIIWPYDHHPPSCGLKDSDDRTRIFRQQNTTKAVPSCCPPSPRIRPCGDIGPDDPPHHHCRGIAGSFIHLTPGIFTRTSRRNGPGQCPPRIDARHRRVAETRRTGSKNHSTGFHSGLVSR